MTLAMNVGPTPSRASGRSPGEHGPVLELAAYVRELETHVGHLGEPRAFAGLRSLIAQVDDARRQRPEQAREVDVAFSQVANPLIHESSVCRYVFDKPRGYAGDFRAMEMIWLGHTAPQHARYLGTTARGALVNAFTLDSENCRANVARVHRFRELLRSLPGGRVAALGAGSVIEVDEAYAFGCAPLALHLFDQDEGALEAAAAKLEKWPCELALHRGNVVRTVLRARDERYDLMYSSGMFDYFELAAARRLVARLWKRVAAGGRLVITNAHPDNPTRTWMELVADWYLVYKTPAEMRSLADGLDGLADLSLECDDEGVYQYLTLRRR